MSKPPRLKDREKKTVKDFQRNDPHILHGEVEEALRHLRGGHRKTEPGGDEAGLGLEQAVQ